MNIIVEEVAACRKRLRVEVPADRVQTEMDAVTADFCQWAKLPGFRPGKAPRAMVLKRYQKEIEEELQRKLLPKAFREACEKRNVRAVNVPEFEEVNFQPGLSLSFSTVVDTFPEFTLPNYKGLQLTKHEVVVDDDQVQQEINRFLEAFSTFEEATDRPLQAEDIAEVSFEGRINGQPILEIAPEATQIAFSEHQWLLINEGSFLPGFATQLLGMNIGETRTIPVTFPEDMTVEALKGKVAEYSVSLKGIRLRKLPEFDDEFAQKVAKLPAEEFRQRIRSRLEEAARAKTREDLKRQVVDLLNQSVSFELPESIVDEETQDIVNEIVHENQSRGLSADEIEEHKETIFTNAGRAAREIVKLNYLLRRIGEAENVRLSREELTQHVLALAERSKMPFEKFAKRIRENGALYSIERRLMSQKVMDLILDHATVTPA